MTKHALKLAGGAVALLSLAANSFADVKLNDNFSVGGYVVGSYQYVKPSGVPAADHFDLDTVKTVFTGTFKPVTGVVSLFYPGPAGNDVTILDAYATYDVGSGYSITAGKFLSYLGYEAFDPVNMTQITYGAPTSGPLFTIPAYHSGVRLDYGDTANSFGLALLDSVYNGPNIYKGDGELQHNAGFEAYYKYTGAKDLVLWAGLAYDSKGNLLAHSVLALDFWAQYTVSKEITIAGEYATYDGGTGAKGSSWLAFLSYASTDKISTIFRVSGADLASSTPGFDYVQYTICPSYAVTANLTVRAEYSYYDYTGAGGTKSFFGVQGLFKF